MNEERVESRDKGRLSVTSHREGEAPAEPLAPPEAKRGAGSAGASPSREAPLRVAAAVLQRGGAYLIGQRPPGVSLAGLWEFPGGKIRAGETPEVAAARECLEETGLAVEVVGKHATVTEQYAHGRIEITFVACRSTNNDLPRAPFRWVAAADLGSYEFPAANAALIRQLIHGAGRG